MRHRLIAAGLTALLAVSPVAAIPAQAAPLTCTGVWVIVDFGSGTPERGCASSHETGTTALRSAGFSVNIEDGFILKIGGKPGKPDPNKAYWSYWHATRSADGSYSNWSYSNLGADAYHPTKGNAEGWRYQSLSEGKAAPRASAPTAAAPEPAPSPTPTKASPTPKPTKKASATATATARATTKATTTASSASASPSAGKPSPTPSVVESTTPPTEVSAVAVEAPTAAATPPASGSPTGTIAAGVAVFAAVGGLGSWWLVKGRRR